MTKDAERHLTKAVGYVAKGDGFYAQAADEIMAAQKADPALGYREIGKRFGRSDKWVRTLVTWRTSATGSPHPYGGQADEVNARKTKQMLREAPLEQIETMIADLPKERQEAIAAAAGNGYAKARQDYKETMRRETPVEKKERQVAVDAITKPVKKAAATFATLGIVGHLEQATEDLRTLVSDGTVTPEIMASIAEALAAFTTEVEVAAAMVGLEMEEIA